MQYGHCTYNLEPNCTEKIVQIDGNASDITDDTIVVSDDDSDDPSALDTTYDTEDEIDCEPIPANLSPIPGQDTQHGHPLVFDTNLNTDAQSSFLPLCLIMNARSVYNKANHLREMLNQIGCTGF